MFDLQPVLEGGLLRMRPLQSSDFQALHAAASDPLIWELHPEPDRWRDDRFQVFFDEALASRGALVAEDRLRGGVIGSSRFHGYDAGRREVEIGWSFLARAYWGGRHNAEMKRLMLGHAFRWIDRVVFRVGPGNLRSQRALEKIGAVREGLRADAAGQERVLYVITANEFGEWGS